MGIAVTRAKCPMEVERSLLLVRKESVRIHGAEKHPSSDI